MKPLSPKMPASYWLILAPSCVAYAAIAQRIEFLAAVAIALLGTRFSNTSFVLKEDRTYFRLAANHIPAAVAVSLFLFSFYLPLPPLNLTFAILVLVPAIGIASMTDELRIVRALFTFAALIASCLFQANTAASLPAFGLDTITQIAAFSSILCICRSTCFLENDKDYTCEFCLALLIALITSFSFDSWVFAALLALLPTLGFSMRNHQLSKRVARYYSTTLEEKEPPEELSDAKARPSKSLRSPIALFTSSVVLLSLLGYFALMEFPTWTQFIDKQNYALNSFAEKIDDAGKSSSLDSEALRETIKQETREAFSALAEKSRALESAVERQSKEISESFPFDYSSSPSQASSSKEESPDPKLSTQEEEDEKTDYALKDTPDDTPTSQTEDPSNIADSRTPSESLTRGERMAEMWARATAGSLSSDLNLRDALSLSIDYRTIGDEQLNLENPNYRSSNTDLLFIAKIEGRLNPGYTLYLRTQTLDTITAEGFSTSNWLATRIPLAINNERATLPAKFLPDRKSKASIEIVSSARIESLLPVPRDYQSVEISNASKLVYDPEDSTLRVSQTRPILGYTIHGAQFPSTKKLQISPSNRRALRDKLTRLPLTRSEKNFLSELATDIAGRNPSPQKLARRLKSYFQKNHAYSFDTDIPPGDRHVAIRWLESRSPGVCSNFASAFTLLARSKNIPCRIVTGYATSEYNRKERLYYIRSRNAHAWVEILDESNRWIRIDPTAIPDQNFLRNQIANAEPATEPANRQEKQDTPSARPQPADTGSAPQPVNSTTDTASQTTTSETASAAKEKSEPLDTDKSEPADNRIYEIADLDAPPLAEDFPTESAATSAASPESLNQVLGEFLDDALLEAIPEDIAAQTPTVEKEAPKTPPAEIPQLAEIPPAAPRNPTQPADSTPIPSSETLAANDADPIPNPARTPAPSPELDTPRTEAQPQPPLDPAPQASDSTSLSTTETPPEPSQTETTPDPNNSDTANASPQPSPTEKDDSPSPLFLLMILAVIVIALPFFRATGKFAAQVRQSPDIRLRARAGRLLHEAEHLIQSLRLEESADWNELRTSLVNQRYGPTANPLKISRLTARIVQLRKTLKQK